MTAGPCRPTRLTVSVGLHVGLSPPTADAEAASENGLGLQRVPRGPGCYFISLYVRLYFQQVCGFVENTPILVLILMILDIQGHA